MTYYNQYEAMEWGAYPHQGDLMDTLLQRSSIRHVAKAHTPTMLMHGENDNDVPIAEAEQFYIGAARTSAPKPSWCAIRVKGTASANRSTSWTLIDRIDQVVREALSAEVFVLNVGSVAEV